MHLTAIHEVHIGVKPTIVSPGEMFEVDDSEGETLLRIGAAREPSAEERIIFGLDKPTKAVAAVASKKRGPKAKTDEPPLPLEDDV